MNNGNERKKGGSRRQLLVALMHPAYIYLCAGAQLFGFLASVHTNLFYKIPAASAPPSPHVAQPCWC